MKKFVLAAFAALALALPTAALADPGPLPIAKDAAPTLCGDANCDGQVDFSDSIRILQHLGNRDKYSLSETGMANADVDGNAGVTANDARCIQMFVAGLLPDLGGQSSIGTPNADLGPVRLMMRGDGGQDRMTAHPGETINVNVYDERTYMKLGGIFLRLGGQLPRGVRVSMDDTFVYALPGNKEFSQRGDYYVCDALQYGEPQEVDISEPIGQFELHLPADLQPGAYEISPIDFCQLFEDGTSHIFDVSYSPLWLMVHAPISYSDPTDAAHPGKYCADYTFYNGEHTLASGWWVVAGANESTARIDVSGDVNILLMDGAELTAAQGFHVTGTNRLTVWAQSGGRTRAGRLNVPSPENCSAGIGGNAGEAGGTVTVNGGVLEIAGGYKSAAIGGGQSGAGGMTTVNGGFVTATGGEWGTGLGGGMAVGSLDPSGNAGSITINGGEVTATGGDWCAGIGGAGAMNAEANNGSSGGTVVINGGIVTANGGSWSAGIGGGRYAGGVAVAIRGGTVTAVSGGGAHAIGEGNGWTGEAGSLAIDGMKVFASASASAPVAPAERESVCRGEWAKLTPCTEHDYDSQGVCTLCGSDAGPVPYLDPTDAASPGKVCEVYSAFTGQAGLTNGWYVARGAVPAAGRVEVAGDVHLILCDGAELTADAGICVAQGNSLTVWAQSDGDGMGALTAVGNTTFNAGIGGNENLSAGTLTINGGRVNASANQGAGIGGGGANTADATAGTGGTVTIRGGTVRVSSTFGSAIGGGSASAVRTNGGAGGTVAILGGTVTVSVESGYAQPVGHGYDTGSLDSGSLGIADGMRVVAGANEGAASDIPSSGRVDACRNNRWARLEPCPHGDASGVCPWCGLVEAWARGYVDWAGANGVAGAWNATDASGIHNVFRYVFDKPAGAFTNPPLIDIEIEGDNAVVITPPVSNTVGFAVSVVESSDVAGAAVTRRKPLDATGRTVFPMGSAASRFYRLSATEGDAEPDPGGVQLWENGPYWAECNVGASAPEECGYYFWWGDTVGYTRSGGTLGLFGLYTSVTWVSSTGEQMSSSPFSLSSCPTYGMDNSTLQSEGYIDATGNLTAAHDAATAHLGAPWRMPTDAEFAALTNNCIATWITTNGVSGRLVTGTGAYADRSIFLPAPGYGSDSTFGNPNSRGYYWSSTPDSDNSYKAWYLDFNSSLFQRDTYYGRQYGLSVRPVRDAD